MRVAAVVAVAVLLVSAGVASAAGGPVVGASYWAGFTDFWAGAFKKQGGIVWLTLGVGAVCVFILTRGKWKK